MSEPRPDQPKSFIKRTWLRRLLVSLAALLTLFLAIILAVPPLVSSNWARVKVEEALTASTGKPASLRLLSFGWSEGLRLEGLLVGSGELKDESFFCSLETLRVEFGFLKALRKDFNLDAKLSGLRLRKVVEAGPSALPAPAEAAKPLPLLLRDTLSALRQSLKPGPRSGDVHILVDMSDIRARLMLPASNSTLDLADVKFHLAAPGLEQPVRLDAGLTAVLNGKELAPVKLEALLEGLVDEAGQLAPAAARLKANAEAPGLNLLAFGSVAKGFKTDLRVDLRKLAPVLKPFAGNALPEMSGALALGLTVSQPDPDHINLGLVAFADALQAVGGPLGTKAVGPVNVNLLQEAELDLKAGSVRLPGKLRLQNKSTIDWRGEATGLNQDAPELSLGIKPLHLQLDELVPAARAWMPPGLGLGATALDIEDILLKVTLPARAGQKLQAQANLKGLTLEARHITRATGPERLSLALALLRLETAQVALRGDAPGQLDANAVLSLEGLRMQGKTPLTVKRIALPQVTARIEGLAQDSAALFGILGSVGLDITGEIQGLDVPGKMQVPTLTQSLVLHADLPAAKSATARLESLRLDSPRLRVLMPGKRPVESPLALLLHAPSIGLSGLAPAALSVSDAKLTLELGQALKCASTSSLAGNAVQSSGGLTMDVQKLLALAAPLLPAQAKGSGAVALDWKLSASLPQSKGPAPKQEKLSETLAGLSIIKEFEAILNLSEVSLDWPMAAAGQRKDQQAETLRLRGLATPKPLRMNTSGGFRESSLSGSLAFGPLGELPGVGPLSKPLRGLLTLNATQQGLRSLQFSELLHTEGIEVDQSLTLTLDRLDKVIDRDKDRFAAILELVDGTVSFSAKTGLQALPAQVAKGASAQKLAGGSLSGKGSIEAGFNARLSGGRSLALSALLLSPGLDLNLGPNLAISGLTSTLRLNKRYSLLPGLRCATPAEEVRQPLSEKVFDLFPTAGASVIGAGGDPDFARAALHEFQSSGGSLGFNTLKLKSGALPLSLHDVFLRLDTSGPLPAVPTFRAGLLGGNMQGRLLVKGARGNYTLVTDLAFTGIDPSRLFPGKGAKDLGDQAETSGRVSLTVPLTSDPEALLQRLGLRADITKIGPRTLERMLYALDPDEQNETIVQQRRLMDIGYPRFVSLGLAYGNLSLSGEVEVKGFRLELPRIDRLPAGNLPIRSQLGRALAPITKLTKALDAVSAESICRDASGLPGKIKVLGKPDQEGVAP